MAVVLPDELEINYDSFTLGEWEEVEDLTGKSFSWILGATQRGEVPMKVTRALLFTVLRRTQPEVTFADCQDVTVTDLWKAQGLIDAEGAPSAAALEALNGGDASDPPPSPPGDGAP